MIINTYYTSGTKNCIAIYLHESIIDTYTIGPIGSNKPECD